MGQELTSTINSTASSESQKEAKEQILARVHFASIKLTNLRTVTHSVDKGSDK